MCNFGVCILCLEVLTVHGIAHGLNKGIRSSLIIYVVVRTILASIDMTQCVAGMRTNQTPDNKWMRYVLHHSRRLK